MCKPNMHFPASASTSTFEDWKQHIHALAALSNVYMKISGGFSEIIPLPAYSQQCVESPEERNARMERVAETIGGYIDIVLDAFGTQRIMFGSDWPVCNLGGGGNELAWRDWWWVVRTWVEKRGLTAEKRTGFWAGTAKRVYGIEEM